MVSGGVGSGFGQSRASLATLGETNEHEEGNNPKYWMLDSLMKLNSACSCSHPLIQSLFQCERKLISYSPPIGHTFIDILKIDIEGSEFDLLVSFLNSHTDGELPISQLQLEIHVWGGRKRFDYFVKWWEAFKVLGLRPFRMEPNLVYLNLYPSSKPGLMEVCLSYCSSLLDMPMC